MVHHLVGEKNPSKSQINLWNDHTNSWCGSQYCQEDANTYSLILLSAAMSIVTSQITVTPQKRSYNDMAGNKYFGVLQNRERAIIMLILTYHHVSWQNKIASTNFCDGYFLLGRHLWRHRADNTIFWAKILFWCPSKSIARDPNTHFDLPPCQLIN